MSECLCTYKEVIGLCVLHPRTHVRASCAYVYRYIKYVYTHLKGVCHVYVLYDVCERETVCVFVFGNILNLYQHICVVFVYVCASVCVRARARVCVRACVRACVCARAHAPKT